MDLREDHQMQRQRVLVIGHLKKKLLGHDDGGLGGEQVLAASRGAHRALSEVIEGDARRTTLEHVQDILGHTSLAGRVWPLLG